MPTVFYTILLIIVLSVVALYGLFRLQTRSFQSPARLSLTELITAFGYKLVLGCLYGYIFYRYFHGDDTWMLHNSGLFEQDRLLHQTWLFFDDLKPWLAFQRNDSFLAGFSNLLSDLEYQTISKSLALFNFISGGNYYINIVFFSFITFWGHYWLFGLLVRQFPEWRRRLFLLIFFFPPVVFWLSGLRGDGLLFFFFSLTLLQFHRWVQERKRVALLYWLLALFGVMVYRSQVAMVMVPGLLAWAVVVRMRQDPRVSFSRMYAAVLVLFFGSLLLPGSLNLPGLVVAKQQEFLQLPGNTRFALDRLEPSVASFVRVLPQAAANSFVRPFAWEAKGPLQWLAAADILFFWAMVLLVAWQWIKHGRRAIQAPLWWFLCLFGVTLYILVGYTVPFPGAIVRYKIIPELGLYVCLALAAAPGRLLPHPTDIKTD